MARLKRLFIAGVPQHLIVRGNDRQDIFLEDADRFYFLGCLEQAARSHSLAIHAYVLMSNHVHLLATGADASSIPKTLQSVGRRYVAHFNGLYGRTGTLWEGRYKAALVQTGDHLVNCQRYIELNPVRAGMVNDPAAHFWSSHRCFALGATDPLITPHPHLLSLGKPGEQFGRAYRSLFHSQLDPQVVDAIRDATNHGWGLGDEGFLEWAGALCGRRAHRIRRPRRTGRTWQAAPR